MKSHHAPGASALRPGRVARKRIGDVGVDGRVKAVQLPVRGNREARPGAVSKGGLLEVRRRLSRRRHEQIAPGGVAVQRERGGERQKSHTRSRQSCGCSLLPGGASLRVPVGERCRCGRERAQGRVRREPSAPGHQRVRPVVQRCSRRCWCDSLSQSLGCQPEEHVHEAPQPWTLLQPGRRAASQPEGGEPGHVRRAGAKKRRHARIGGRQHGGRSAPPKKCNDAKILIQGGVPV